MTNTTSDNKLPVLKFTITLMVMVSVLFTCLFAYINQEAKPWTLLSDILVTTGVFTVLSLYAYGAIKLLAKAAMPVWLRPVAELLLIFTGAFFFLYLVYMDTRNVYESPAKLLTTMPFRLNISVNLLGTLFIYILEKSLTLYQLMLDKAAMAEKMEQEYSQVRLQALKSQVNPHFLFNSLSVLSSLVYTDAATSERFIIQLSQAYRYILEQKDTTLVSLEEELNFLDAYFFLLQIRFGKKIKLEKHIHTSAARYQLPPLTLQLLVENAVKHNKMSAAEPLTITITADEKIIEVKNNFNPREAEESSTGIGLDNIRKRLAYTSNEPVLVKQSGGWFSVTVPLCKPAAT